MASCCFEPSLAYSYIICGLTGSFICLEAFSFESRFEVQLEAMDLLVLVQQILYCVKSSIPTSGFPIDNTSSIK